MRVVSIALVLLAATTALHAADEKKDPLKTLEFRSVGPAVGGRVDRVAGVPGDPRVYYLAAASGGVWKTTNGGHSWEPIFDKMPTTSTGSIAVAPSDPNVVYVGSGEANIRGNVMPGLGIFKSTDAGKTWTHVWKQVGQIGTIAIHPKNPDVAFAAVLGHAFGPNPERGVYRTTDGGKTWQQVLKKDPDTGASDVAIDTQNPRVIFAGMWQARRRPWELTSGGPGSGLWVSRDGGDTWKQLTDGLPKGVWGKVGVAVAPSDSSRVYAVIEADEGGLFRSTDGGESWELASNHPSVRQRAWYYSTITVDPKNPEVLWLPQVPMIKSSDGGKTLKRVRGIHHGDHHDVWIDPLDSRRMITSNDGGVDISIDGGESFFSPALPLGQCYHVAVDNSVPFRVSCAQQDLGTASGPSNSLSRDGIVNGEWRDVGGGEAGHTAHDPSDPNIVYAGEYLGYISRYDERTRQARHVGAWPDDMSGHGAVDAKYRFQWTAPIHISPHDPKTVYHGANVLFRTKDGGQSWTAISPDLTRSDPSKQQWSGGPITGDNTGVEHYETIFTIAESPVQKGVLWAGSDDGLVHVTRDDGATWTKVTPAGVPDWATVSILEPSPFDAATAYVVVDAHRMDDNRPYLWKTTDYGKTWKTLAAGLPADVYLHSVREDPKRRGTLYLGTARGVMFSRDDGAAWQELKSNLPPVPVADLVVKNDSLVLGTHGRSIWILDDLTPVREWTKETLGAPAHVFTPPPVTQWRYSSAFHEDGPGENPPEGVVFYYLLKDKPKGDVTVEVRDASGTLVRTLSSKQEPDEVPLDDPDSPRAKSRKPPVTASEGLNKGTWDLSYGMPEKIWKAQIDWGSIEYGPRVLPGRYTLKLIADDKTATTTVDVRPDPRVTISDADRAEQLEFGLQVREAISRVTKAVRGIQSVRAQVQARRDVIGDRNAAWKDASAALLTKLDALEEKLHNPRARINYHILAQKGGAQLYSRLIALYNFVLDADGVPTQGMRGLFAELLPQVDALENEWKALVSGEVAKLNASAKETDLLIVP